MTQRLNKTLQTITRWIRKERKGRFSQSTVLTLVTRPIWQHDRIRAIMGAPLFAAVIVGATSGATPPTDSLQGWDITQPPSEIAGYSPSVYTNHTYLLPVSTLTGISQYFHPGHPGLDFRAPLGSGVLAMDNGTVTQIVELPYGYGRHIYIQHSDNTTALYAHLGLIMVEVGEHVTAGDKVGEIGLTGWTTGPHLHFEVTEQGAKINPMTLLSRAIASYVANR